MSARARQSILILKTGEPVTPVRERRGQFADLIREAIGPAFPGEYQVADIVTAEPPAAIDAAAIVITGSAANVPDRAPWMLRAEAWLREVVARGTPTFGICFGHQILAQALGGEVQRNPRGREMGTLVIDRLVGHGGNPQTPGDEGDPQTPGDEGDPRSPAADPIFEGLPACFEAHVTHVDSVIRLPPGARALARSEREDYHAIRFSESCYGVQFHPEMDADVMRAYVEARREILAAEGFAVDEMVARIREADAARQTLRNFVRHFL